METISDLKASFEKNGQGHVFDGFETLSADEQKLLIENCQEVDLAELDGLVKTLVLEGANKDSSLSGIEPAPFESHPSRGGDEKLWNEAKTAGEKLLRAGKVAAFTVAGGQGTRLGFDGPKGTFRISLVRNHPLFQIFAEKILAAERRYESSIPWFIMTSHLNHEATVGFFAEHDYFGLNRENVHFFRQGRMPAVDKKGKIIKSDKSSLVMSPDGHGGSLRALVRSGSVDLMASLGIEVISYFQVDNPLVHCIDPAFIGFHSMNESELSSKMIPKAYAGEKVGVFCRDGDKTFVVEYSDLPDELAEERTEAGDLKYLAGSIAIHLLSVDFVKRVGGGDVKLPFHRADKKIPYWDIDRGEIISPDSANGIKFEMFVFDALPFARNPVIIETLRSKEFSPVKNPTGIDSAESCRADQLKQFARWFQAAKVDVKLDREGLPLQVFEISPLFADSKEAFVEKWKKLEPKPTIDDGLVLA